MRKAPLTVCVVGGGFTGAAASIACLARIDRPFRLIVVEPSASLGRGVAYGAHHPLHLLNARTRDLSVRAGQPGDFLNWAFRQLDQGENHAGLHEGLAHTFLPRQLFGEYVRERFFEAVEVRGDAELKIVNAVAISCVREGNRFTLRFDRAEKLQADVVLLATAYGLQASAATGALAPFDALPPERISGAKTMTLIGCAAAEAHGTPWQAVINNVRSSLQDIWQGLPVEEQARFLRHVRPLWDAHRHRLPLEVHGRLQAEFNEGRAVLLRGRVTETERDGECFRLVLRRRGSKETETLAADLAFDCTGHRPDLSSPLIQSLVAQGIARADAHRLGLAVEPNGQVLSKSGAPTRGLFALGPLGQGSLWEITAVPEIVRQCDAAAQSLAALEPSAEREVELSS